MKVKVTKDNRILPVGSVCEVIEVKEEEYHVMHSSFMGSYQYDINKRFCEVLEEDEE